MPTARRRGTRVGLQAHKDAHHPETFPTPPLPIRSSPSALAVGMRRKVAKNRCVRCFSVRSSGRLTALSPKSVTYPREHADGETPRDPCRSASTQRRVSPEMFPTPPLPTRSSPSALAVGMRRKAAKNRCVRCFSVRSSGRLTALSPKSVTYPREHADGETPRDPSRSASTQRRVSPRDLSDAAPPDSVEPLGARRRHAPKSC